MAATRLVEQLVARNAPARMDITVLGDEDTAPYNRILLSAVLEGTHRPEALTLRDEQWYADNGVDLRLGARVLGIDRERQDVMLVDGTLVEYDVLVLATGSIPSLPPIRGLVRMDGSLHEAVHAFRSLADCRRLLAALPHGRRAVVVGGGLLGLQVARALGVRGIGTEVVEGADHLLHQQLSAPAARILARDLRKLGVAVYTGARAVRLVEGPTGPALRLDNGFTLDTDLVVLTAGGRPSTALARGAGLEVRRGIVVDDRLASVTDPSVHALGDCAEHDGRTTGFVPPAWEQAEILAGVLCDDAVKYDGARIVARLRATDLDVAVLGDAAAELAAHAAHEQREADAGVVGEAAVLDRVHGQRHLRVGGLNQARDRLQGVDMGPGVDREVDPLERSQARGDRSGRGQELGDELRRTAELGHRVDILAIER